MSASSAIRWRAQERREGDVRPKRQGGDRHSQRIEAHAELILSAVAAKSDITLAELQEGLKERAYITAMLRISITAAAFEAIAATLASSVVFEAQRAPNGD